MRKVWPSATRHTTISKRRIKLQRMHKQLMQQTNSPEGPRQTLLPCSFQAFRQPRRGTSSDKLTNNQCANSLTHAANSLTISVKTNSKLTNACGKLTNNQRGLFAKLSPTSTKTTKPTRTNPETKPYMCLITNKTHGTLNNACDKLTKTCGKLNKTCGKLNNAASPKTIPSAPIRLLKTPTLQQPRSAVFEMLVFIA